MNRSSFPILLILFIGTLLAACAGAPFKVAPRVEVPVETIRAQASSDRLELRAMLLGEDEIVKLFDGNLLLAGIIPVRVALTNRSQEVLGTGVLEFKLTDGTGRGFPTVKAKDVMKQLYKYYGVRLYSYAPEQEMRARFLTHGLMLEDRLQPAESRQGLIFFKKEKESPIPEGLRLQLTGSKSVTPLVVTLE
jgi:hypothetical protein